MNLHTHFNVPLINPVCLISGVPRNFVRGGGTEEQIQLRTEDGEKGDLGTVAPLSGVLEAAVVWYK